jgi:hypothetical protein
MDDDAQIQYLSLRLGPRNLHLALRKKEGIEKSYCRQSTAPYKCKYSSVTDYFMQAYLSDNAHGICSCTQ